MAIVSEAAVMPDTAAVRPTIIGPARWALGPKLRELWDFRDLFYFFIWRDVKVRYAQSVLGVGWAIVQPLVPMIIFTIVFGTVARIESDGHPYALFSIAALVPWTYFSNALSDASGSLVKESAMLSKIYFPRLIIPFTAVLGRLLDLAISFVVLVALMLWYGVAPTAYVVVLPALILIALIAAAGLGMWLSALAVQYRDVKHALGFVVQFMMYAAPVVYPTSKVPAALQYLYALNPMVGVIEGFRSALLGSPMRWDFIAIAAVTSLAMFWVGAVYFVRREPVFADVA
jgi:lipopolysaccharide transport system permease protein